MLVITYMVKLKHDDVRFPAIHTGIFLEIGVYKRTDALAGNFTILFGLGDNPLTMLRVVPAARFPTLLDIVERHRYILQAAATMQGTIDGGYADI